MAPRLVLSAVLMVALASGISRAEIIEIPLPGLAGEYAGTLGRVSVPSNERTLTFDVGGRVAQVNGAWIQWSGSVAAGRGDCQGSAFRWVGTLSARLGEPAFGAWQAGIPAQFPEWETEFIRTQRFESSLDPGWDFLSDGTGEITVAMIPALYFCGEMIAPPVGIVTTATLILDVELEPVAVEAATWGRVKALYRD